MSEQDIDEIREQLNAQWRKRGPLCPADLDPDVWAAVAANYDGDSDWAPGPEYHAEYRDSRTAALAMREKMQSDVDEARELANLLLSIMRQFPTSLDEFDERLGYDQLPGWAGGAG